VIPLRELCALLRDPHTPLAELVAITFDDTFRNNHDVALPILEALEIPATFFVTTGMIGSERRFWVDELEHMVNHASAQTLEVTLDRPYSFALEGAERRIECVRRVKSFLKRARPQRRELALQEIRRQLGYADDTQVANYRNLTWEQVKALDASPWCEVGGHTVNHETLSTLDDDGLEHEIGACIDDLAAHLGHEITSFSYPEGQFHDFDERAIALLKRRGIGVCPTAVHGLNQRATDPFLLKRIMVGFNGIAVPFAGLEHDDLCGTNTT
jgi:peptidoglycan/xylan/chitin deacetylase (PgdA/CDA1 family)